MADQHVNRSVMEVVNVETTTVFEFHLFTFDMAIIDKENLIQTYFVFDYLPFLK